MYKGWKKEYGHRSVKKIVRRFCGWKKLYRLYNESPDRISQLLWLSIFKTGGRISEVLTLEREQIEVKGDFILVLDMPVLKRWKKKGDKKMRKDLHYNIETDVALNYQTINSDTTTNGNIIDTKGFNALEFVIMTGTLTDGDYAPQIQEGDESDLSDAATVAAANLLGTAAEGSFTADTDDNASRRIGVKIGNKRYYRLNIVSTNTSSGAVIGAVAIKGVKDVGPTDADT